MFIFMFSVFTVIQPPVQWVPRVLSPGVKRGRGVTLTTHPPSSAEVVSEYELYLLSPKAPPWRVAGLLYFTVIQHVQC
jgi:hypothetical protein